MTSTNTLYVEDRPLLNENIPFTVSGEGIKEFILQGLKSDAKSLRIDTLFINSDATKSNYKPRNRVRVEIFYKNIDLDNDVYYLILNKDEVVDSTTYKNTSEISLKGNDILKINIIISNKSIEPLDIKSLQVYQSQDLSPMQLVSVLKEQTIAADVLQATSVFSDSIFTQLLQTSVLSMTTRNVTVGQQVDYLRIEGEALSFYTATLGSEEEQFTMTTTIAGRQTETHYWYAIIAGDDAYKYITTVDPRVKYPDISDSKRDEFRLMVYKPSSLSKKLSIAFEENEDGYTVPVFVFGAGTSTETGSTAGQGLIYKDENGFYQIYNKSDGSGFVGIIQDDFGVHIKGLAPPHCEDIVFKDNGVKMKFVGEDEHKFEYIISESNDIVGYIQNTNYITNSVYEPGLL